MIYIKKEPIKGARVLSPAEMNDIHFSSGKHSLSNSSADMVKNVSSDSSVKPDLSKIKINLKE